VPLDARAVIAGDVAEIVDRDLPWSDLSGAGVLVTGATGMLPSYAVLTLLALNDRHQLGIAVHALARSEAKARAVFGDVLDRPDLHLLIGDVTEPLELPGRLDWVLHGASPARPALHASDPVGTLRANIVGTMNLLELCRAHPGSGLLLMSSAEVYGKTAGHDGLIDEDSYGGLDILSVRACYPEGKRAAETTAAAYSQQHGVGARIARFGHIYGPGLAPDDGRVQADFAANVATGQDIVLNSDGSATRTYTYVADAVAGMFTVLLRGADSVAYNVSDERGLVSIRELATLFTQVRPERGLKLSFTGSAGDRAVSAAKAQGLSSARLAALGWRPQVDQRTGQDRMVTAFEAALS
jgi:nucleoside-diphosphate-sugar epimerase